MSNAGRRFGILIAMRAREPARGPNLTLMYSLIALALAAAIGFALLIVFRFIIGGRSTVAAERNDRMPTQAEKAIRFQALHQRPGVLVVGNPWDAGTARILTALGYAALSTTSAGLAFALGKRDGAGAVSREEAFANRG